MFDSSLRLRACAALQRFCMLILLASSLPITSSVARADSAVARPAVTVSAVEPVLGWTWTKLFSPVERVLANQTRMIQFGVVALISAMYIIWWRK